MIDKSRQPSYNSYLRQSAQANQCMSISTQSGSEQQLALEAILMFVHRMNSGKVNKTCLMTIRLQFEDSERSQC